MSALRNTPHIKVVDFCIMALALGVVAASFLSVWSNTGGRGIVHLKGSSGEWVFPLDAVETIYVSGPLGDSCIEINGNAARIIASPCAGQTCVAAGSVYAPGQWAACLPNRVMIYVGAGENESGVDAAAW